MLIYVGPDQIIPLSGVVGTTIGLALLFWGKVAGGLQRLVARVIRTDRQA